jgi:hypothetical protein
MTASFLFDSKVLLPAASATAITTTAAAAVSTTTATAAAVTTAAAATATATRTIFTRFSFVNVERAAIYFLAVELRDRCFAFFFRRHFDETESARAACFTIFDDVSRLNGPGLAEQLFEILIACIEGKVSYV